VAQIVVGNATLFQQGTFHILTATLGVTKTSSVISDPINLTGAGRKAIPGAVMEYAIASVEQRFIGRHAAEHQRPNPGEHHVPPGRLHGCD